MTRTEKHQAIRSKLATRQVFVLTFTKKDGSLRQMRCRYEGGPIRRTMMQVRDLDLNEVRTVNLATVSVLWAAEEKKEVRQDREPKPRTFEEVRDELHALFY